MLLNNLWEKTVLDCLLSVDFHLIRTIKQLLDSDWPANILARLNFWAQEIN